MNIKIVDTAIKRFELPLLRPLTIGGQTLTCRCGLLLEMTSESGQLYVGECSPLPGLHRESLEQAERQLRELPWPNVDLAALYPSVRNAIGMVMRDAVGSKQPVSVALNGLLMTGDDSVESLLDEGYRSIKVKVGRQSLERDIERILVIKSKIKGHATLRLDANRSWSLEQACRFGQAVGPSDIEYIEEPTHRYEDHADFIRMTGLPVTWDESLLAGEPFSEVAALVLKPAILGGFKAMQDWIQWAQTRDIQVVISSCFEGPWALRSYARLAYQEGFGVIPQGLDTWRWLDCDWSEYGLRMEGGRLWV